jgi:hypothetical protein
MQTYQQPDLAIGEEELLTSKKLVIVIASNLATGMVANRCAALSVGITSAHPEIVGYPTETSDGIVLGAITRMPIPILIAKDIQVLPEIENKARSQGCTTLVYLSRAQGLRSYQAYLDSIKSTSYADLDIDAIAIYGEKKTVSSLTGSLPILR